MTTNQLASQIATLNTRRDEARANGDLDAAYRISKKIVILTCQYWTMKRAGE